MTNEQLRRIVRGPKTCPACGEQAWLGEIHCPHCGQRIRDRNPLLRLFVTFVALSVVGTVVWWKLRG